MTNRIIVYLHGTYFAATDGLSCTGGDPTQTELYRGGGLVERTTLLAAAIAAH